MGCPDFKQECVRPTPRSQRLAQDGCAACAAPRCASPRPAANLSAAPSVRWLHIPKCGMTFALSVLNYACGHLHAPWHYVYMALEGGQSDVRMAHSLDARHARRGHRCDGRLLMPFAGHLPVQPSDRQLVVMFRRPAQRLISAFHDNYHAWGLGGAERNAMKRAHPDPASWARYPGIAGCMTKMLAGYDCGDRYAPPQARLLPRALALLRSPRLAFVGLVEHWAASVCLFHRMLGGGATRPWLAEFRQLGHSRNALRESRRAQGQPPPSLGAPPAPAARHGYNESVLGGWVDREDEAVYAAAVQIFRRNLERFGVSPNDE